MLPVHLHKEQDVSSLSSSETKEVIIDKGTNKNVCTSPINETQSPLLDLKNCAIRRGRVFLSQIEEGHAHNTDPSFSEEAYPADCGEMSESIKPARKFKRLRKAEDTERNMNQKNNKLFASTANFLKPSSASNPAQYKHGQGDFSLFSASFVSFFIKNILDHISFLWSQIGSIFSKILFYKDVLEKT